MRTTVFVAVPLFLAFAAPPALAVDLVNDEKAAHRVTVTEGGATKSVNVKAGETIKDVCQECTVAMEGGASREVSGPQVVTIMFGRLMISGGGAPTRASAEIPQPPADASPR